MEGHPALAGPSRAAQAVSMTPSRLGHDINHDCYRKSPRYQVKKMIYEDVFGNNPFPVRHPALTPLIEGPSAPCPPAHGNPGHAPPCGGPGPQGDPSRPCKGPA